RSCTVGATVLRQRSMVRSSCCSAYWAVQPKEHCKLQAARDPLGAVDEDRRDFRGAKRLGGAAEMAEPDVEILLADLLQLEMGGHRAAAIGAVLQDDRTPEVGHLLQVRFPVAADFPGEDGPEPRVGANPAIEVADQDADEGAAHRRVNKRQS